MKFCEHACLGAAVAVAPDFFLLFFGWRRKWMPETYWAVRAHRFLHSNVGLVCVAILAWATHIIADRFSKHRTGLEL